MIKALLQLLLAACVCLIAPTTTTRDTCRFFCFPKRIPTVAEAIVVGGILLPHGDFALDPTFFADGTIEREVANDVATGARQAGRWLIELLENNRRHRMTANNSSANQKEKNKAGFRKSYNDEKEPTIILLTTPHGIKLDYDYGIYIGSKGSGSATIGGDCIGFQGDTPRPSRGRSMRGWEEISNNQWIATNNVTRHCQHKPYNVTLDDIDLAPKPLAEDLLTVLRQEKGHPVSGIYSYNDEAPIPLNWGEIVPLLLLPSLATSSGNQLLPLIWTFPYRRYNHSKEMVPELLQVGADIMEWAHHRPETIAIVVSGDLSHTHQSSGPYGYSAASAPFDEAIGLWAGGHTDEKENSNKNGEAVGDSWDPCRPEAANALLKRAKELQTDAKSCGFTGYVLWHGMVCSSFWSNDFASTRSNDSSNRESFLKNNSSTKFNSSVFVNRNVTYYGMIAAIFEPKPVVSDEVSRGNPPTHDSTDDNFWTEE